MLVAAIAVTTVCANASAQQSSPGSQQEGEIHAHTVFVQYIDKTPIPAQAEGALLKLNFQEGDLVNEGDVLAIIDDTAAKQAVELKKAEKKEAELNAANDVNIRNARNSYDLADAQAKAFIELHKEGAAPFWEMKTKEFEADRAKLSIEMSEMDMKVKAVQMIAKRTELEMAEFELTRRNVKAPLTGHIEERIAQTGQWVRPGDPIATLIQMDKLRVEGYVDALRYPGQIRKGSPVRVIVQTEDEKAIKFNGKLGYRSLEINSNQEYRVWIEIANQRVGDDWLLKPGMKAEIIIENPQQIF
jgi:multidrug resistance efflux pump